MKSTHKYGSWPVAIAMALLSCPMAGCETPIEFSGEEMKPYVVMYGMQEAGDSLALQLSFSRFFLSEKEPPVIDNAAICLRRNGSEIPLSRFAIDADNGHGTYYFATKPKPGDTLEVVATVPGDNGATVTAKTCVPQRPTLTYVQHTISETDGQTKFTIRLRLADTEENNYYRLRLNGYHEETQQYSERLTFSSQSPYFAVIDDIDALDMILDGGVYVYSDFWGTDLLFEDGMFNGEEIEFDIHYDLSRYSDMESDGSVPMFQVQLISYSKEGYMYLYTVDEAFYYSDEYFYEPVQLYSNVQGGTGVFAASNTITDTLPIHYVHRSEW